MSALTIGELVGFIRADDTGMRRGLAQSQLRMRGFQLDTEGRLRDLSGNFVDESQVMAMSLRDDLTGAITVANNATNQFTRDANGRLRDVRGRFVAAGDAAQQMGDDTADGMRAATQEGDRFSLSLGRIVGMAGGLGRVAAGVAPIVGALGAAIPVAAGLVATLQNIVPAAAVAVSAQLALKQATGVVKLAAVGMDDAISAALDPEKAAQFEEALAKLAPEAREFAQAIKDAAPELRALQQDVQDRVFRDFAEDLKEAARVALPVVRKELLNTAGAINTMGRGVLAAAKDLAANGTLGRAMGSASQGLHNLAGVPQIVVTALGQLAAAAGPSFERLTTLAGEGAAKIGEKLGKAFESGALQDAIETAISLIGDLVDVAKNVGSILNSVFKTAQVSGGGLIGTLEEITGALADAFASPEVQGALKALVGTMSALAREAGPLLGQALRAIGPVFEKLGPPIQRLIAALGDALGPVIEELAPILEEAAEGVGILIDAARPFLPVISDLLVLALRPLQPILVKLGEIFRQLAPVFARLAETAGAALTPVLEGLGEIAVQLVEQFGDQLITILPQLAEAVVALTPYFIQLGVSLGEILKELAPLLPKLMSLGVTLLSQLLPAILPILPPLAKLAALWLRLGTFVITGIVLPALKGLIAFIQGMQSALQPGVAAVRWLVDRVVGLFRWLYNVLVGNSIVPDMVNAIVRIFAGLPGRSISVLASLGPRIASLAASALRSMGNAIGRGLSSAVSAIRGLPGRARAALGGLGGLLTGSGQSLIRGFINGILGMIGQVRSAASSVVSAARDYFPFSPAKKGPFAGQGYTLHSGRALIDAFQAGIEDRLPGVQSVLDDMRLATPDMTMPGYGMSDVTLGGLGTSPAAGRVAAQPIVIRSDGSRVGAFLVEVLREAVDVRGGNVQFAVTGRNS